MKRTYRLSEKDVDILVRWGYSAEKAGFGDNQFNRDDDERRLRNRLVRWQKVIRRHKNSDSGGN